MKSIEQFFSYMNDTDFQYVVLRNFEKLPDLTEGHNDIDLLVYDLKHFREIFPNVRPEEPFPRVRHKLVIDNQNVYLDLRSVGDGYYPIPFSQAILENRVWYNGFYTPCPTDFRLGLIYHAVHHKSYNKYQRWIGDLPLEDYLDILKSSSIGYEVPLDGTVGRFNQYFKGATSIVSKEDGRVLKKQTGWTGYNLIENEYNILSNISSNHFPNVKMIGEDIEIEDCGEELTVKNLPDNWKEQLIDILANLKSGKVVHRDIKPDNLMIKNGIIKLIDFGWAIKEGESDNPPRCLGMPYKPSWGWDDNFSMRKVIKEIEYQLEEGK